MNTIKIEVVMTAYGNIGHEVFVFNNVDKAEEAVCKHLGISLEEYKKLLEEEYSPHELDQEKPDWYREDSDRQTWHFDCDLVLPDRHPYFDEEGYIRMNDSNLNGPGILWVFTILDGWQAYVNNKECVHLYNSKSFKRPSDDDFAVAVEIYEKWLNTKG